MFCVISVSYISLLVQFSNWLAVQLTLPKGLDPREKSGEFGGFKEWEHSQPASFQVFEIEDREKPSLKSVFVLVLDYWENCSNMKKICK